MLLVPPHRRLLRADYTWNISRIPGTILHSWRLGKHWRALPGPFGEHPVLWEAKRKVLFVLDGLGWNHSQDYRRHCPALQWLWEVTAGHWMLNSVFPSTTPVALWAFHTGQQPCEGKVMEFGMLNTKVGRLIQPMAYAVEGEPPESLIERGILQPEDLYLGTTIYQVLARSKRRIPSVVVFPQQYSQSAFTRQATRGATVLGYRSLEEATHQARQALIDFPGQGYLCVYIPDIDATGHHDGLGGAHRKAVERTTAVVQRVLTDLPREVATTTAALVTADHGMVPVLQNNLHRLDHLPEVMNNLRQGNDGQPILPTGSPMVVSIHTAVDKTAQVKDFLTRKFDGQAWVLFGQEALEDGFFGTGPATPEFRAAVGDVLVIPYPGHFVWREPTHQKGLHGGLDRRVMEVPLFVIKGSA